MTDLTISFIQTSLYWEDTGKNLENFSRKIASISRHSDLILLPEMFSTGFTMNAEKNAGEMNDTAMQWMKAQAKAVESVIAGSLLIKEEKGGLPGYYNRLIWMRPDGSYDQYDKRHLFSLAGENVSFTQGSKKLFAEIRDWKIFPLICYDLRFPVWSRRTEKENYDLLIYVANWPDRRIHAWRQLLMARAIENQCYVAGVNRIGKDGTGMDHPGYSAVIDFKGEVITEAQADTEKVETVTLSKKPLDEFRSHFPFSSDQDVFELK